MRAKPLIALGTGVLVLAVAPPAANADKEIGAASGNRYAPAEVTIDQGEKLTFRNRDFVRHDVTSTQIEGGKPLFATPLIGQNETAFVEGSQYLVTGTYDFLCTVHPEMKGRLVVTSGGTPVPRPGTGGGADTTAPKAKLAVKTGTVRKARKDRALKVAVTLDEDAKVTLRASAGKTRLVTRTLNLKAGTKTVTLKLDRAGLRRVKKGRTISFSASATDAAGNKRSAKASRKLR